MLGARIRQRVQQDLSVVLGDDASVEEHDGTVVRLRADEPAEALAKPQGRLRQLELDERIVVALGPPLHERIVGHAERKPCDDDAAKDIARQVDTLPKRLRAEKHGAALSEALEQRTARAVDALGQHSEAVALERSESRGR